MRESRGAFSLRNCFPQAYLDVRCNLSGTTLEDKITHQVCTAGTAICHRWRIKIFSQGRPWRSDIAHQGRPWRSDIANQGRPWRLDIANQGRPWRSDIAYQGRP